MKDILVTSESTPQGLPDHNKLLDAFLSRQNAETAQKAALDKLSGFCEEVYPHELYRGKQPSDEQIARMADAGIKTIISLRGSRENVQREEESAHKYGLNFVNVPLGIGCPSRAKMDKLMGIMANPANQPVFINCWRGIDRTGVVVAAYRMSEHGISLADAKADFKSHNPGWWDGLMKQALSYYK